MVDGNEPGEKGATNRCTSDNDSSMVISQNCYSFSEGLDAKRKPGDNESSVVKHKAGRKRRGRSMGRYPFLTWARKYIDKVGNGYAPTTVAELERRYRRMDQDLRSLFDSGKLSTTNPEKITADDILAYVTDLKKKGMRESGILHNLGPLNGLLAYSGNPAVTVFKQKYRSSVPKKRTMRYPALEENVIRMILDEAEQVQESDWKRLKAYALVLLALSTGLRNKEIRACKVMDLDLSKRAIVAEHVKGEATYGQARTIAIRPEAIGTMKRYLKVRSMKVAEKCPYNLALFPALRDVAMGTTHPMVFA